MCSVPSTLQVMIGTMVTLTSLSTFGNVHSFTPSFIPTIRSIHTSTPFTSTPSASSSSSLASSPKLLDLTLEKPLGILLEEVEEGTPSGVQVEELSEAGSAFQSPYQSQLLGRKVARVMDQDVTQMSFDEVMECIINAPSPLQIAFEMEEEEDGGNEDTPQYEVGTTVTIQVKQEAQKDLFVQAKVGDNLRKTLLENKVELYRGLKKKLGNCGGGGQCTFCAVDFVESDGWQPRSDYEDQKIGKLPTARLACLNNIQGPATIRVP